MNALSALLESREMRILTGAFWPMLKQGLIYTIPLTLISFAIGMVIAVVSALLIINRVPLLSRIMRLYVWVFRARRCWCSCSSSTGASAIR